MKSFEQMGGAPEQPKEEPVKEKKETPENPERKITTPEEAAEMTRQRREEFGLGDKKELTPEEVEKIETDIQELLGHLYRYDFEKLDLETQEAWYWVGQEAEVGLDRELARANLQELLNFLQKQAEAEREKK